MEHVFDNVCTELEYNADPVAFNKKLNGPSFIGQGGSRSVGSDCYGYYIVDKKVLPNGKTIWGYSSAKSRFEVSWTDGSQVCDGPTSWKPEHWMIARGKVRRYGKTFDVPQWWNCDENGKRIPRAKCNISWTGACAYQDPSF